MMPDLQTPLSVIETGHPLSQATGAIVLLHGRGSSAHEILALHRALDAPHAAFLAPEAFQNSWYPYSFLAPIQQNEPWLTSSLDKVRQTIDRALAAGIPADRVIVAGFSQGACLATEFVARNPTRYAGLLAFTGGLLGPLGVEFNYHGDLNGTPAFLGAGDPDTHVPWPRVEESASVLAALGANVNLKRYPGMPHTIGPDEIREARSLIAAALSKHS